MWEGKSLSFDVLSQNTSLLSALQGEYGGKKERNCLSDSSSKKELMRFPQIQKLQASNMARPGWGRTSNQNVSFLGGGTLWSSRIPLATYIRRETLVLHNLKYRFPVWICYQISALGPLRCLCPSKSAFKSFHVLSTNNRNILPLLRTNITTVLIDRFGEAATPNPLIEHLIFRLSGLSLEPVMTCRCS